MPPATLRVLAIALLLGSPLGAQTEPVTFSGDLRTGYFHMERDHRDGEHSRTRDFRVRVRPALTLHLTPALDARLRVAGRYSTAQDRFDFYLEPHAPGSDGLLAGQATIDEAYLNLRPASRWNVRLGRMQTKFALADLMAKSLDRGDSPNTDITWTDGAHLTFRPGGGWRSHLILQHNSRQGPSNAARSPLTFEHDGSRVTVFAALENPGRWGIVSQRGLDVTYIPRALPTGGEATDYVAVLGRAMLVRGLPGTGASLAAGGELGYAPRTPTHAELGLGGNGGDEAGGLAYQLAATLQDLPAGHRLGVVYSRTQAGWLIAPDFRNNDELIELRYEWVPSPGHSLDARVRRRDELLRPPGALRDRRDTDLYLRYSLRF
jgi:hypothetical protein